MSLRVPILLRARCKRLCRAVVTVVFLLALVGLVAGFAEWGVRRSLAMNGVEAEPET